MVILNSGNNAKEELWNDCRVYTIEAKDVECIIDLAMNWIYVVLSRVTSAKGLYLLQPLKLNLTQNKNCKCKMEYETLLHLQKNGNFLADFDLETLICDNNPTTTEQPPIQSPSVRKNQKGKEWKN